jgi:DnaJ-class molecular chaperone
MPKDHRNYPDPDNDEYYGDEDPWKTCQACHGSGLDRLGADCLTCYGDGTVPLSV